MLLFWFFSFSFKILGYSILGWFSRVFFSVSIFLCFVSFNLFFGILLFSVLLGLLMISLFSNMFLASCNLSPNLFLFLSSSWFLSNSVFWGSFWLLSSSDPDSLYFQTIHQGNRLHLHFSSYYLVYKLPHWRRIIFILVLVVVGQVQTRC